ncbi:MAG TPA: 50S ribosomal protein L19 [Phycisphaerae bacterium]|jgi:large subunit ribosomal protein L19|nr:50S ribosomal protein L19 [Phycisphaerae bacterium]HOB75644.1 50S ribosomal protein L19 [Phycisphaerae bacterium]HOJ56317.1 50S ribosomal protein L19 [Phycisphaerae bacterium]HOL28182.1 50S ribosomal protein L19 [Phycisphaerae bacterium]HPP22464.1 50S ribosomal protein L19 [Phycisphaerae bacterium]
MIQPLLQIVEDKAKKPKADIPQFAIGDTVTVHVRIVEGDKERIQPYTGVVIARRGTGINETFTVRRIVNNEGVERIFPLHSPKIGKVEVVRSGYVRRAKLYYLRDRVGKSRRLRDKKTTKQTAAAPATTES